MAKAKSNYAKSALGALPAWARIFLSIAGLAIAYGFASRAIDTGSLMQYGAAIVITIVSIRLFLSVFKKGK